MAAALSVAFVAVLVVARLVPTLDIDISRFFFAPNICDASSAAAVCGIFPAARDPVLNFVRDSLHYIPISVAILLLGAALAGLWRPGGIGRTFEHGAVVEVVSFILCTGLIVNVLLKDHWGRPRPYQTDLFGGPWSFIPAGRISDLCAGNCSFVSGEASGAFWLICVSALFPPPHRLRVLVAATMMAVVTAILRVSFGAHYFSDVFLAGLLSLAVFAWLAVLAARLRHRVFRTAADSREKGTI